MIAIAIILASIGGFAVGIGLGWLIETAIVWSISR